MRQNIVLTFTILFISATILAGCARRKDITVNDNQLYSEVGRVGTPGSKRDLKVVGDLAFVADEQVGLTVVDISDRTAPQILSINKTTRFPYGVDAFPQSEILITAEGSGDVGIYNYSNPDSLINESTVYAQSANDVFACTINDSMFIWVADRDRDFLGYYLELTIDPWGNRIWSGFEISEISLIGVGQGCFYKDGYIYLASGQWGLHILDARNYLSIQPIGSIDTNGNSQNVYVDDNLAFIADGEKGIQIIDVTDKTNPVFLSNIDTKDSAVDLFAKDDLVFLATSQSGLYIIDVLDPLKPKIIQRFDTANASGLEVIDDYIYLIDKYDGLIILKKNE